MHRWLDTALCQDHRSNSCKQDVVERSGNAFVPCLKSRTELMVMYLVSRNWE